MRTFAPLRKAAALVLSAGLALGLAAAPAAAQEANFSYRTQDIVDAGEPGLLILLPQKDVRDVVLELSSAKGRQIIKRGALPAGMEHRIQFKTPAGVTPWHARLTARVDGPPVTMEFDFEVAALPPLEVRIERAGTNLPAGKVVLSANRPLKSADVQVFDKGGEQVVDTAVDLAGQANPITVTWRETGPDIRRVDLKLTDAHGTWTMMRAVSWYAEIPHVDVIFDSAKWDIRPDETAKLDPAVGAINSELDRFRAELGREAATDAALYVAGHTDTVGSPADNAVLSEKRARAIAEYFRGKGVKVPVYYLGAGERGLAVETGDNVDEARNRRAVYVLSNAPPGVGAYAGGGWHKL